MWNFLHSRPTDRYFFISAPGIINRALADIKKDTIGGKKNKKKHFPHSHDPILIGSTSLQCEKEHFVGDSKRNRLLSTLKIRD